jgi:hypothetical protein
VPGTRAPAVPMPGLRARPADLLVLSFAGILSGHLGRVPLVGVAGKEAPLLLTDGLIALAVVGGAWLLLRDRRLELDGAALLALVFAGVGALSALMAVPRFGLTVEELLFSLAYLARWLLVFGLYLVVVNLVTARDVERIWAWLEAAILVFAGFGIFQAAFLPDFAFMVYPEARPYLDWDPQGHRLVSTFLDPNFAGMLLVTGLLIQGGRLAFGVPVAAWKPAVLALGLALTLSRSSVAALLAGAVVILAVRAPSKKLLAVGGALAVAAVLTLPLWLPFAEAFNKLALDDPSGLHRVVQWGWALTVLQDHPVVGVGFNTYGFVHARYTFSTPAPATFGLDGGLLFIAVMTGLVGVLLFSGVLWLLFRTAGRGWRSTRLPGEARGLALGAGALVPAVVVHSLFANTLLYVPLLHVLWIVWGLAFVIAREGTGPEIGPGAGLASDDQAPALDPVGSGAP